MTKPLRILAIEGGGIRGLIPAMLMAAIEQRTGRRIADLFDLIAGTSTGGLLALGAVKPAGAQPQYTAEEMVQLYELEGPRIFQRTPWRLLSTVGGLTDERYPAENIEAVLSEYFGQARLAESLTDIIVPAYDIQRRAPLFFKSAKAKANPADDFFMWEVARATSAAPSYFEPAFIQRADRSFALVDGGVIANSPAMCAYAEARRHHPEAAEVLLVSLGTGDPNRPIALHDARHWGLAEWLAPLFTMFFDGMSDSVDYQLAQLLPPSPDGRRRYFRFQTPLAFGNDNLDDASRTNIRALKLLAEDLIRLQSQALDDVCAQLVGA